jgi:EmrB/QacA subfamily drug resistance transporter
MASSTRILPLTVAAALFMEQMDSTIIATSLVDIAVDLGVSAISLKLAFTTYLLGLTVMLPLSGWLADRFGAKTIFRLAIVIFTAASFACGFAEGLGFLVAARGLQGIGAAMMVPVGRIIILKSVKKNELLDAIAWLTIPALIGPVIGPPIGGFITVTFDWRWIFWMNLPFGVLAFVLASKLMPNVKSETVGQLDVTGFLLSSFGLTLTVCGMTFAGRDLVPGGLILAMIAIGPALLVAYVIHALRAGDPLLDLRLFQIPTYRWSVIGGSLFRLVVGAMPFLLPLALQIGFGLNAFDTGLVTLASALGALLMKFTVAPLVRFFGYRNLLIVNGLLACLAIFAQGFFTAATPYAVMFFVILIGGFFRSLQFSSLNTLAYADIEPQRIAKANALYTVLQQLTLAIGVAVAAALLDLQLWWRGSDVLQAHDFSITICVLAVISALGVFAYAKLATGAGASVSGRGTAKA